MNGLYRPRKTLRNSGPMEIARYVKFFVVIVLSPRTAALFTGFALARLGVVEQLRLFFGLLQRHTHRRLPAVVQFRARLRGTSESQSSRASILISFPSSLR
jgi:hypothetical protein